MKVRIAGPSGELVLDVESSSGSVGWFAAGMPDGTYRYEAVVLTYNPDLDSGEDDGDDGERLVRTWGSLRGSGWCARVTGGGTGGAARARNR